MELESGSGSSKHSRTHPEVDDGSGSSKHSRTNPEEVVDGSESSKHSTTRPEATVDEGSRPAPAKKLVSSSSSSSSSTDSSLDDLFQVNTNEVTTKSRAGTTASPKLEKNGDEIDDSSNNSEESDNGSNGHGSSSQVYDITHESVLHSMSPTQSPLVQVMERAAGDYDPFRIPSSVFAISKSATPLEWSVASNESLFSIHVGNNSFSRDHFIMLGGDLRKPEDLAKSGELFQLFTPHPPVTTVETDHRMSVDVGKINFGSDGVADESIKGCTRATTDDISEEKKLPPEMCWNSSSSISHRSDGSGTSTRSFAFPIKKKCAWPSCYCSNCSRAFCYSWNCSRKRFCCFSSPVLAEGVRNGSVKPEAEQQHLRKPKSKVSSNWATNKCFPCFFRCPRRRCC